jgi:2-iminobutanoate/2-iminopropanoate deaminase
MHRQAGNAPDGPPALGPYSHYVIAGELVFVSGQLCWDPATGALNKGSVAEQTRLTLANLDRILRAAGSCLANVVRCGVFLADMADFAEMNGVYAEFFPSSPPVRSTVAVKELPAGVAVEIDAIATLGE